MASDTAILWIPLHPVILQDTLDTILSNHSLTSLVVIIDGREIDEHHTSFATYYWLLRDVYEDVLACLPVRDGLRIDLQVFIFPEFVDIGYLPADSPIFGSDLPEELSVFTNFHRVAYVGRARETRARSHEVEFSRYEVNEFPVVALGGTFDRLHAGHKLMISSAIILAKTHVIIGLTGALTYLSCITTC